MKIIRRINKNKINEVRIILEKCRKAGIETQETIFTEYKSVPNATRLEHAAANYPLFSTDDEKSIKSDILKLHNQDVRKFNKSLKDLDMEIIGVEYEFPNGEGKKIKIVYDEIAEGIKAKKAAEKCEPYKKGYEEKQKRLLNMSYNKKLKLLHDIKYKKILEKINKRKRK